MLAAAALLLTIGGGGGAVAGSLITSKQIKNNSITSADIKNKTITNKDLAKAARKPGATGRTGPIGPAGERGSAGATGAQGERGAIGEQGARGLSAWETVPSGVTVSNEFWINSATTGDRTGGWEYIAFPGVAPAALGPEDVNFAPKIGAPIKDSDDGCTGSLGDPTAPPGKVCIYLGDYRNVDQLEGIFALYGQRDRGFNVFYREATGEPGLDLLLGGVWAYTAR